jgi:hypothetical protein
MDPDPAFFASDLQDINKKKFSSKFFFCLFPFKGTFTSFFNNKKSLRSHKTVGINVFINIFA